MTSDPKPESLITSSTEWQLAKCIVSHRETMADCKNLCAPLNLYSLSKNCKAASPSQFCTEYISMCTFQRIAFGYTSQHRVRKNPSVHFPITGLSSNRFQLHLRVLSRNSISSSGATSLTTFTCRWFQHQAAFP